MRAAVVIHSVRRISDAIAVDDAWVAFAGPTVMALGVGDRWRDLVADTTVVTDGSGMILTPGFIDIHVHGGGGASFGEDAEATATALATHRRHGTTRSIVSLVSAPVPELQRQLEAVRALMRVDPTVLGSHLEGPFLSAGFKGAHDASVLTAPTPETLAALLEAADGTLRQVTLAPELSGADLAIATLVNAGVAVAIGHTAAGVEQTRAAFDAGASILTHAFNGMAGIHHRAPGPVAAAIESPHVTIELVGDGTHVVAPIARLLDRLAPGRVCLVTDAMAAAGSHDGDYRLGSSAVRVTGGVARLVDGDSIAGSTLTMDAALRFAVTDLRLGLPAAVAAVTSIPARAIGVADRFGRLAVGAPADAVLLDGALAVQQVWADGRAVRTRPGSTAAPIR